MERKIGEIFQYNDKGNTVTLQVIEDKKHTCTGCFFFNKETIDCTGDNSIDSCSSPIRTDNTDIIYKQIDNNNMEEKRNIQLSLEEAIKWYNSGSVLKELALKVYKEEELTVDNNYDSIYKRVMEDGNFSKIIYKTIAYKKLLIVVKYLYKKYEPTVVNHNYIYYIIIPKLSINFNNAKYIDYKDLGIKVTSIKPYDNIYFNSLEAAKKAIDILGDKLKILFE